MLPQRLKSLRKNKGLTQQDIADFLGITRQGYAKYENGQSEPDHKTLGELVDYFDTNTDYLLGRTDKIESYWNSKLPELTDKDEKDIAKKLQNMIDELEGGTSLAFDGEPMDDDTRELVLAQIERNLRLTKQHAKQKFTPKKYRNTED